MSKAMSDMGISPPVPGEGAVDTQQQSHLGWLAAACVLLPLLALISPINHDETQYIAAAQLTSDGFVPFRDFLYLQTPYQIYFFAPVFELFERYGFLASRVVTALSGGGALVLAYAALRRLRVDAGRAAICSILLALCHTFVFSVTVVRNDALPALLLSGAMLVAAIQLAETRRSAGRIWVWAIAGALLGMAAGAKISYLAPALCLAGFPVGAALVRAIPWRTAILWSTAATIGLALALAPLLWFREAAPLAFDYGNFGYHAEAPLAWYAANGLEDRLTLLAKVRDVFLTLIRGPALFALVVYVWLRLASVRAREAQRPILLLIDVLVFAGLVATIAPTPTWRQYAMPLLPPLFVGFGLVWQEHCEKGGKVASFAKYAFILAAVVGVGQPVFQIWKGTMSDDANPLIIQSEGAFLAREAANAGLDGPAASLSPEVVLASGLPLDPTFATGPFAYRTGDMIAEPDRNALRITTHSTVAEYLAQTRPDAIVTGYENFDHVDALGLEVPIEEFARNAGYRRLESPHGAAVIWLRDVR